MRNHICSLQLSILRKLSWKLHTQMNLSIGPCIFSELQEGAYCLTVASSLSANNESKKWWDFTKGKTVYA